MEFEKCPRCGGEWVKFPDHSTCCKCHMDYTENRLAMKIGKGDLYWIIKPTFGTINTSLVAMNKETCIYADDDKISCGLPWLPFDITEERLKLLLVFS